MTFGQQEKKAWDVDGVGNELRFGGQNLQCFHNHQLIGLGLVKFCQQLVTGRQIPREGEDTAEGLSLIHLLLQCEACDAQVFTFVPGRAGHRPGDVGQSSRGFLHVISQIVRRVGFRLFRSREPSDVCGRHIVDVDEQI